MSFGELFKSSRERGREKAREVRRKSRNLENQADRLNDKIAVLKKKRDQAWSEAREYLKDSQKLAAQRCLKTYRAREVDINRVEKLQWMFENKSTKIELRRDFAGLNQALLDVIDTVQIDPDDVAEELGQIEDKLGDLEEVDKIWDKAVNKDIDSVDAQMTDELESLEELEKHLEEEVAADLNGTRTRRAAEEDEGAIEQQIGEGHKRLKALMEGDK